MGFGRSARSLTVVSREQRLKPPSRTPYPTVTDAHEVYDRTADTYAAENADADARATYEWPMVRDLLPPLDGRRVLDAATGTGDYARWMADRGARVVGVDASRSMTRRARDRCPDAAVLRTDLRAPLPFSAGAFDLVVSQLTLEHVRDWDAVAIEFARVLRSDGCLVVSTDHPSSTYFVIEHEPPDIGSAEAQSADYYAVERYERDWGDARIPFYRRPLREVLRPLFAAGFAVEDLREPSPDADPDDELLGYFDNELPRFLGLRARLTE
ncbi:hypothetical protein BRD18_01530 [Halobacteriales archaeon SW_7_71_33]|nr:MAG: hypothetical protein BRD18_01530 [Halobacteriales archaeon SW_7_71_33]